MKKIAFCLLLSAQHLFGQALSIVPVATGVDASFRALSVVDDSVAWVGGSKGWVGRSTDGGRRWSMSQVAGCEKCDFRSLYAFDAAHAVIANAGTPGLILYTANGGNSWQTVYTNNDTSVFFDGITFWNDREGIIYGDPINGKLLLLRTTDGGRHWKELPPLSRPELAKGEASFAASGTTIRYIGTKLVIATGGARSRLLISENKGMSWRSVAVPVTQGMATKGIFSMAWYSNNNAVVVGGDYKQDTASAANAFYTTDNGKTWHAPHPTTRGYRECAEYIIGKTIMAVGPGGMDISYNGGAAWQPFADEQQYHVIRKSRKGKLVILAGGKGKIALLK